MNEKAPWWQTLYHESAQRTSGLKMWIPTPLMMNRAHTIAIENAARLDSWKDIAQYFNRNVRSVQRWEKLEAMPVHRHGHRNGASVYAYKDELDAWRMRRNRRKQPIRSAVQRRPFGTLTQVMGMAVRRLLGTLVQSGSPVLKIGQRCFFISQNQTEVL